MYGHILTKEDEQGILLIAKEGIAAGYYHQKHRAVTWEDSDLRAMLRSGTFLSIFSRQEIKDVAPAGGDLITLLSVPEALELFHSDKERELEASRAAVLKGINTNRMSKVHEWDMKGYRTSWWWLRGNENEAAVTAPIVSVDGEILTDEKNVNKPGGAIRPVIRIRLQ